MTRCWVKDHFLMFYLSCLWSFVNSLSADLPFPNVAWGWWSDGDRPPSRRAGTLPLWSRLPDPRPRGGNMRQHDTTSLEPAWASLCWSVERTKLVLNAQVPDVSVTTRWWSFFFFLLFPQLYLVVGGFVTQLWGGSCLHLLLLPATTVVETTWAATG